MKEVRVAGWFVTNVEMPISLVNKEEGIAFYKAMHALLVQSSRTMPLFLPRLHVVQASGSQSDNSCFVCFVVHSFSVHCVMWL